jgi:hypothetical protein
LDVQATEGPTSVHGGEGNDTFHVSGGNLDSIQGRLTITGDQHNATPTQAVASSGGGVYTEGVPVGPDGYQTNSKFARNEPLDREVGDRLYLWDDQAVVSSDYFLEPRAGDEVPPFYELAVVSSWDEPAPPARRFSQVDYATVEGVQLEAGTQNDVIEVFWSSAEQLPHLLLIGGGGGEDNYAIFHGTPGGDLITIGDRTPEATVPAPVELDKINRFRVMGGGGDDLLASQSTVAALLEGNGGDDILVTERARGDVLLGGDGRDALFSSGPATFYLPDAELNETGTITETRVDGDLVVADGVDGRVSSRGSDKISGTGCGEGELFVESGEIGVLCWLKAIFRVSSLPILGGPEGAQARVDQLTARPEPNNTPINTGGNLVTAPAPADETPGDEGDTAAPVPPSDTPAVKPVAGDVNADGVFDQYDILAVLKAGLYYKNEPAQWDTGDWNGDGRFDQQDLLAALQSSGYGSRLLAAHGRLAWTEQTRPEDEVLAHTVDWLE